MAWYVTAWWPSPDGVLVREEKRETIVASERHALVSKFESEGAVARVQEGSPPVLSIEVRMELLWVGAGLPVSSFRKHGTQMSFGAFSAAVGGARRERAATMPAPGLRTGDAEPNPKSVKA